MRMEVSSISMATLRTQLLFGATSSHGFEDGGVATRGACTDGGI